MIYRVRISAPAIEEEITLAAESEEEAKTLALISAGERFAEAAEVTVTPMPPAAAD